MDKNGLAPADRTTYEDVLEESPREDEKDDARMILALDDLVKQRGVVIHSLHRELREQKSSRMVERKLLEELNDSHLNRDHGERGEDDSLTGDSVCDWWEKKPCTCFLSRDRKLDLPPAPDAGALIKRLVTAMEGVGMNWKLGAPYGFDAISKALEETKDDREKLGL